MLPGDRRQIVHVAGAAPPRSARSGWLRYGRTRRPPSLTTVGLELGTDLQPLRSLSGIGRRTSSARSLAGHRVRCVGCRGRAGPRRRAGLAPSRRPVAEASSIPCSRRGRATASPFAVRRGASVIDGLRPSRSRPEAAWVTPKAWHRRALLLASVSVTTSSALTWATSRRGPAQNELGLTARSRLASEVRRRRRLTAPEPSQDPIRQTSGLGL
jgi:hypothetical protein